ncbi:MAG: AsmA family protein [Roseitalea sp.]|jgi:AsmA protein|nr:AsmA family protein [Roseitalea sp.]MBO6723658.1 AsmA family protein [Roseitalea sp.]MBO6744453.1 AsmA family protein [Roseitalea sp.]
MGKSVLRAAAILAVLLVAMASVVALSLPWLVSTDIVQSSIERELGNFFGTRAELGGQTHVTIFPRPRTILSGVAIAAPGERTSPILTIESMEADIGLVGLVSGRPQFSNFKLVRPHLQLLRDPDGTIDWLAQSGRVGRLFRRALISDGEIAGDQLGSVVTEKGRITLETGDGTIIEDITAIDANLHWPQFDAPMAISADAIWRGTAGSLTFNTRSPRAFFLNAPSETGISLDSDIVTLNFEGAASAGGPLFADGTMRFSTPSLQTMMTIVGTDVTPGRALGEVVLSGPVRLAQRRMRFEGLDISVDGNSGSGVLEIGITQQRGEPTLTGTLDFRTLDIAAFLSAFINLPQLMGDGPPSMADVATQMNTDLRVSAAAATFGDLSLENLAATAQVSGEVAIFDIGDALAYGGHVQARLALSFGNDDRAEVILSGQDVDTAAIGEAFALPRALPRGRGNFSITLNASTGGPVRLRRALGGMVSMEVRDGVMPGFGVNQLYGQRDILRYFSLDMDARGETFSTARIYGDIAEGLLTLKDTRITYPDGDVLLEGIVTLGTGSLALTAAAGPGVADAAAGDDGDSDAVPPADDLARFFVGGSWNRPFATPVLLPPSGRDG